MDPWPVPDPFPTLGDDEVHLWRAVLDRLPGEIAALRTLLSADEQERAGRYRFERDRHHYTAGRGVLRLLLARYLGVEPAALRFAYNRYGKPTLAAEHASSGVQFNLSHSADLALYAVSCGRALGVDLERVRADFGGKQIAERFFSPVEVAALQALPPDEQGHAFFRCWTRKEAYIKARGAGLAVRLDRFDVSLAPGAPAALLADRGDPGAPARWRLQAVDPAPDVAGALAVEGHQWRVCCWQWGEGLLPSPAP